MPRKKIISGSPAAVDQTRAIDISGTATVMLTSETTDHPIDHAFDGRGGPGGTRWVAGTPGEQTVVIAFDAPQTLRQIALEIEEKEAIRCQEIDLAVSCDGERTYQEILRQEYNFSPSGSTFEREEWSLNATGVTHFRLRIKPDKGGGPYLATLTTLALR